MAEKNRKNKKRTFEEDFSKDDSSFAALAGEFPGNASERSAAQPAESQKSGVSPAGRETPGPFRVNRSRKGNWPIQIENRPGGKKVTVLSGVQGDAKALLRQLRKAIGAGGTVREGAVEVQGEHKEAIAAWLDTHMPGGRS